MSYDFDIQADYRIRDTNMTQNGGQQSCTESPEESEKASMQVSALLCNLLQTSKVPPTRTRRIAFFQRNQQQTGCERCEYAATGGATARLGPV